MRPNGPSKKEVLVIFGKKTIFPLSQWQVVMKLSVALFMVGLTLSLWSPSAWAVDGSLDLAHAAAGSVTVSEGNLEVSCHGSLIGADLVLTAAHCVTPTNGSQPVSVSAVSFSMLMPDGVSKSFKVRDIAVDPTYTHKKLPTEQDISRDIALLRLSTIASSSFDNFGNPDPKQPYVALLPLDPNAAYAGVPCKADYHKNSVMVLACRRVEGSSGSGVYQLIDGERVVVGVVSAIGTESGLDVTFAVEPIPEIESLKWQRDNPETITGY